MPRFTNRPPKKSTLEPMLTSLDPTKAVKKPPRLKPATTREYGKGGTPYSGAPDFGIRGAGIKYGGI